MIQGRRHLLWNLTKKCNFTCHYCYFPHDNSLVKDALSPDEITTFLDSLGGEWLVGMTGGEPFIYPHFLDICRAVTKNHIIGVDTNLSVSSKIAEFADTVNPARVHDIYAALHIEEREKRKGVDAFIRNYHALKEKKFNIIVNYVVHPTLLDRFFSDKEWYAKQGVAITPRPFKGKHDGKRYPEAYGEIAKDIFAGATTAGKKTIFNFKDVPCTAGHTFLRMEPDGTILRCPGDRTVLGNITGHVAVEDGPTPCRMSRCPCSGIDKVVVTKAQEHFLEGVQHTIVGARAAARTAFSSALKLAPHMANAACNLGVLELMDGNTEQALRHFTAARAKQTSAVYETNALRALRTLNKTDEADRLHAALVADGALTCEEPLDMTPELCHFLLPEIAENPGDPPQKA